MELPRGNCAISIRYTVSNRSGNRSIKRIRLAPNLLLSIFSVIVIARISNSVQRRIFLFQIFSQLERKLSLFRLDYRPTFPFFFVKFNDLEPSCKSKFLRNRRSETMQETLDFVSVYSCVSFESDSLRSCSPIVLLGWHDTVVSRFCTVSHNRLQNR